MAEFGSDHIWHNHTEETYADDDDSGGYAATHTGGEAQATSRTIAADDFPAVEAADFAVSDASDGDGGNSGGGANSAAGDDAAAVTASSDSNGGDSNGGDSNGGDSSGGDSSSGEGGGGQGDDGGVVGGSSDGLSDDASSGSGSSSSGATDDDVCVYDKMRLKKCTYAEDDTCTDDQHDWHIDVQAVYNPRAAVGRYTVGFYERATQGYLSTAIHWAHLTVSHSC